MILKVDCLHLSSPPTDPLVFAFPSIFSGLRSENTNISRFEIETSGVQILRGRIYALYLRRRIGDPAQSNILPRDVDVRTGHVDNEKKVCSAVVPKTGIHALVVIVGVLGSWVDEERLDVFFNENRDLSRRILDCRRIARCGWVTE